MTWDGAGNFNRVHNFSADASAGIKILASRQDAEWANFEGGLENCLTRDGQNAPTADLPMGGQKHTNVGAAASVTQYLRADQYIRQIPIYCAFGGTAEAMSASAQFALTSLTAGIQVLLSCPSVNTTTSVTLGLGGAATATVLRADGIGPSRGQVKGLHRYIYDGANWILTDPSPVAGRILVANGTASASGTTAYLDWASTVSAIGFSASGPNVIVPGGIRAVRVAANVHMNFTAASASGDYYLAVEANGGVPNWGGQLYQSMSKVFFHNRDPGMNVPMAVPYVSVKDGDRIRFSILAGVVTTPTSVSATWAYIEAID